MKITRGEAQDLRWKINHMSECGLNVYLAGTPAERAEARVKFGEAKRRVDETIASLTEAEAAEVAR